MSSFQYGYIFEVTRVDVVHGKTGIYAAVQYSTMGKRIRETGRGVLVGQLLEDSTCVAPMALALFSSKTTALE